MRINESSLLLEVSAVTCQVLLTLVLAFAFSHHLVNLYQLQWLAVPVLLWALLSSGAKNSKAYGTQRKGIYSIIAFQLLLFMLFYGTSAVFGAHTFAININNNFTRIGFFPWSIMLIIAIGLQLLNSASGKDASIVDLITRVIPVKNSYFLTVLHLLIRGSCNFSIGLTLALITINSYSALTGRLDAFSIISLLLSVLVLLLIFAKPGKYLLKKTTQSANVLYVTLPMYAVVLAVCLAGITHALASIATLHTKPPVFIQALNTVITAHSISALFSMGWWLAWAGVGGIFIAHHSRALSLRQMIVWSSITPLIISLCVQSTPIATLLTTTPWSCLIAIPAICGLLYVITQKDFLPCLILAYLPQSPTPKQRAHQFLFISNLKTMLLIVFISIPIGLNALSFFACFLSLPLEIFLIVIVLAVGLLLRHDDNTL